MKNMLYILGLILVTSASEAGVHMTLSVQQKISEKVECQTDIFLDQDFMRTDFVCDKKPLGSVIYLLKSDEIIQVDHSRKGYFKGTGAETKAHYRKSADNMAKRGPRREKGKEPDLLSSLLAGGSSSLKAVEVKKTGKTQSEGAFTCQVIEERVGENVLSESCYAEWSQGKIDGSKYQAVIQAWKGQVDAWRETLGAMGGRVPGGPDLSPGILIKRVSYRGKSPVSESRLVSVKEKSLEANLKAPPKDYKLLTQPMVK